MRVAVTGAGGQLGRALLEALTRRGHTPQALLRADLDLEDPDVESRIASVEADWVIHCAAFTAVDRAETEPARAHAVNASGTAAVARGASRAGARMLFISTDYVFDGALRRPYDEHDPTEPLNVYGQSKRAGERAALELLERPLVVRTSWLMGGETPNFAATMLRLGRERERLSVVSDQVGRPTWVFDLAPALVTLTEQDAEGVLHLANRGQGTWYEVAQGLFDEARKRGDRAGEVELLETTTEQYNAPADRPRYSVLALTRTHREYGISLPEWRAGLPRAVEACR